MSRLAILHLLFVIFCLSSHNATADPGAGASPRSQSENDPQSILSYHAAASKSRTSLDLIADYLGSSYAPGEPFYLPGLFKTSHWGPAPSFQHVIVTVPGIDYGYDQHVDAVLHGAASIGYQLQSYWIAGEPDQLGEQRVAIKEESREPARSAAPAESRRFPGIILMRPQSTTTDQHRSLANPATQQIVSLHHHLLIYLVPESPSSGVSLPAFAEALSQISTIECEIEHLCGTPDKPQVAVLGPTFSASRESLARAVANSPHGRQFHFDIVSGRASSDSNAEFFRNSQLAYSTVMHGVKTQLDAMLSYLCEHDPALRTNQRQNSPRAPEIALLIESSTNWGQELHHQLLTKNDQGAVTYTIGSCEVPLLVLPYRIHIGDMAKLVGPAGGDSTTGDSRLLTGSKPAQTYSIASRDAPVARSLSGLRSQERALASLLRTIAQEQIWYVGVISLTAEDKYLLLRQVHELMPGVQLFTLDADLMDTHPEHFPFTKGMLTASSYPVFAKTQLWQWPLSGDKQRIQFPRSRDIGVHNAFTFLLAGLNPDEPAIYRHLIGYGPSQVTEHPENHDWVPSVWISRVTGEGLVPTHEYIQHVTRVEEKEPWRSRVTVANNGLRILPKPTVAAPRPSLGLRRTGVLDIIIVVSILCIAVNLIIYILHRFFCDFISNHPEVNLFGVFSLPAHAPPLTGKRESPKGKPSAPVGPSDNDLRYREGTPAELQSHAFSRLYRTAYFLAMAAFVGLLQWHSFPLVQNSDYGEDLTLRIFDYSTEVLLILVFGFLLVTAADALFFGQQSHILRGNKAGLPRHPARTKLAAGAAQSSAAPQVGALLYLAGGLALSSGYALYLLRGWNHHQAIDIGMLLYLERATNLSYGLSILVPWLCVLILFIIWITANRHRLRLLISMHTDFGYLKDKGDPAHLLAVARVLGARESGWLRRMLVRTSLAVCVGLFTYLYVFHGISVYENFAECLSIAFASCYSLISMEFFTFLTVAYYFERALLQMGSEPMLDAYRRLPVQFARNIGIQILESLDTHVEHQSIRLGMALLKTHYRRIIDALPVEPKASASDPGRAEEAKKLESLKASLKVRFGVHAGGLLALAADVKVNGAQILDAPSDKTGAENLKQAKLVKLLECRLKDSMLELDEVGTDPSLSRLDPVVADGVADVAEFLTAVNLERPLPSAVQPLDHQGTAVHASSLDSRPELGTRMLLTQMLPDSLHLWLRQAEDLVAVQRVMFINRVFSVLRAQLAFVVTGLMLLLLAFNLFPFQPLRLMMTALGSLMAVILSATLWIFVRLERDEVLSYIGHSPPGELTWSSPFIGRLVAYIGVPLLTFLVAQISWLRTLFVEVVTPLLMGLR